MAITLAGPIQDGKVDMGQHGRTLQWGIGAFSTTDATGTINTRMRQIESVQITPLGAPATDETLYWADTVTTDRFTSTGGAITIGRTGASPTSGLRFSYLIIGFAS